MQIVICIQFSSAVLCSATLFHPIRYSVVEISVVQSRAMLCCVLYILDIKCDWLVWSVTGLDSSFTESMNNPR